MTLRQIDALADSASEMGQRVRRTISAWEEVAASISSGLASGGTPTTTIPLPSLGTLPPVSGLPGDRISPAPSGSIPATPDEIGQSWYDQLIDLLDNGATVGGTVDTILEWIREGRLDLKGQLSLALTMMTHSNNNPDLEPWLGTAENAADLAEVAFSLATRTGNPFFALASLTMQLPKLDPVVMQISETAHRMLWAGSDTLINQLPNIGGIVDLVTLPMDRLLGYATPEQEKAAREMAERILGLLSRAKP